MSYEDPEFVEILCRYEMQFKILLALSTLFFLISLPYLFVDSSELQVVGTLNVVGSGAFMVLCVFVVRKCNQL